MQELNTALFDGLGLPVRIHSARVKHLAIQVSWLELTTSPFKVTVDGLHVVAELLTAVSSLEKLELDLSVLDAAITALEAKLKSALSGKTGASASAGAGSGASTAAADANTTARGGKHKKHKKKGKNKGSAHGTATGDVGSGHAESKASDDPAPAPAPAAAAASEAADSSGGKTWSSKFVTWLVDAVSVKINDVHVRVEVPQLDGVSTHPSFAVGVTLNALRLETFDALDRATQQVRGTSESTFLRKVRSPPHPVHRVLLLVLNPFPTSLLRRPCSALSLTIWACTWTLTLAPWSRRTPTPRLPRTWNASARHRMPASTFWRRCVRVSCCHKNTPCTAAVLC